MDAHLIQVTKLSKRGCVFLGTTAVTHLKKPKTAEECSSAPATRRPVSPHKILCSGGAAKIANDFGSDDQHIAKEMKKLRVLGSG